jgi:uncharacterized membrane protein HdeD (DUF308 family)
MTFAWPDITPYLVSILVAWYLIVFGIVHLVSALAGPKVPWLWTPLLLGIAELFLGVWAIRSWPPTTRSCGSSLRSAGPRCPTTGTGTDLMIN